MEVMNNIVTADLPKEMQSHHYPILFQVEETHWWYVGRRRIIQSLIEKIAQKSNNPNPTILDVGCGTGANLKMLAAYGKGRRRRHFPTGCRVLPPARFGFGQAWSRRATAIRKRFFRVVTALDVVEHLDDDVAGLREMRRVLRCDGRLLLFVPAFMFLWGVQDDGDEPRADRGPGRRADLGLHPVGAVQPGARRPQAAGDRQ